MTQHRSGVKARATATATKKGLTGRRKQQYVGGALRRAEEGSGGMKRHTALKLRRTPRVYRAGSHSRRSR